ncbi:Exoglucanase 1 [Dichotomopilus funicola]|uniref:Glucanase n=1 Tax=Dichotomopilus funicola TaxID=1934379 RepID=A0AAN6V9T8_9PEZI|nr:Exoglucanase 1 [Dichotomopilus funicola]
MYYHFLLPILPLLLYPPPTHPQKIGLYQPETHPPLRWTHCTAPNQCTPVPGAVTLDANYRWLHRVNSSMSCFWGNTWDETVCDSAANCTETCAIEGAEYGKVYGVETFSRGGLESRGDGGEDAISLRFRVNFDYAYNIGSRLFLLEPESSSSTDPEPDYSQARYQTFTLRDSELAFDVDLSTVACGINGALSFVRMPADGQEEEPTANAFYGTGYCDATCPRSQHFIGSHANFDDWLPSSTDPVGGTGRYGACCGQFRVWDGNAHSFSMSAHVCPPVPKGGDGGGQVDGGTVRVCEGAEQCDYYEGERGEKCDFWGCGWNPYRMGGRGFYGVGGEVDTGRVFTVVTRWTAERITQFLIQDGQTFEVPAPTWEGLPTKSGLSADMCEAQRVVFGERDNMLENGGWDAVAEQLLDQPMVLSLGIGDDHFAWNLWLDSIYPTDASADLPGAARGDCLPAEDSDPQVVENTNPAAYVIWSNIRFGPIGSTVEV